MHELPNKLNLISNIYTCKTRQYLKVTNIMIKNKETKHKNS